MLNLLEGLFHEGGIFSLRPVSPVMNPNSSGDTLVEVSTSPHPVVSMQSTIFRLPSVVVWTEEKLNSKQLIQPDFFAKILKVLSKETFCSVRYHLQNWSVWY